MSDPKVEQTSQFTSIDLGDDLLEKTAAISGAPVSSSSPHRVKPVQEESVGELIRNAEILIAEGFIDEAKKNLRQILLHFPDHSVALRLLKETHEEELKRLMNQEEVRRFSPYSANKDPKNQASDQDILRQLDQDFKLGLSSMDEESLWSPELLSDYGNKVEKSLAGAEVQDWIDLGIGFLEMTLYPIASRLFAGACKRLATEFSEDEDAMISSTVLHALSLTLAENHFEAISSLQPVLQNLDIAAEKKLEVFYLMGRIHESIERVDQALYYFQQGLNVDPHYRDIEQRIKKFNSESR